nr:KCU-star family selenoprotein [Campylobacter sp.]
MKWLSKLKNAYDKIDGAVAPIIGLPSYEKYLEHFRTHHPDQTPLSRAEFFKEAQDRKGKQVRCC